MRNVAVDGLWLDEHPVTNLEYGRFVRLSTPYRATSAIPGGSVFNRRRLRSIQAAPTERSLYPRSSHAMAVLRSGQLPFTMPAAQGRLSERSTLGASLYDAFGITMKDSVMMRPARSRAANEALSPSPRASFDAERARLLAVRIHGDQLEPAGAPLIAHIRRVALATPEFARPVAWMHELLEWTSVAEQELLEVGVSDDELRALRLLNRSTARGSEEGYLAHVEMIARASGHAGRLARSVKLADLQDRIRHDHRQADGSRLPYERALELILDGIPARVRGEAGQANRS